MKEDQALNDARDTLDRMREAGLPVTHTMFATIHIRSEQRPDGYTGDELDQIANELHERDMERWKEELSSHTKGDQ